MYNKKDLSQVDSDGLFQEAADEKQRTHEEMVLWTLDTLGKAYRDQNLGKMLITCAKALRGELK